MDHFMLMQQRQELVAEVLLPFGSVVLQGLQVLAMAQRVQLMILIQGCTVQRCLHVLQLTSHLQMYVI